MYSLKRKLGSIIAVVESTFNVKHKNSFQISEYLTLAFESPEIMILIEFDYNLNVTGVDFRQSDIHFFESYYL